MEAFWRQTGVQLGKHWKLVLLATAAITAVMVFGIRQLEFATGQESYLNPDSQAALDNVEYQDAFGGETVILLFTSTDGEDVAGLFQGDNLTELERMAEELRALPGVYSVVSPLTAMDFTEGIAISGAGTNALLGAIDREPDEAARAIRQADLEVALARLRAAGDQTYANPDWVDFLLYENTGFTIDDDGELVAPPDDEREIRRSLAGSFPQTTVAVGGILIEGNATLDELSTTTDGVLEVMNSVSFDGYEVISTGSPVYLKEINDYLQGGMLTLGAAAAVIMAIVLGVMFRVRWRLLPLAVVLVGVVWGFALLGFIGIDLSLVTISGLPILIGVGIDFAIQIHNRVEEEVVLDSDEHPIAETVANLAPALIVATIGGVLAFLALRISRVPMIRDFGVMLAIGIVVLVVVGIVLPTAVLGIREYKTRTSERGPSIVERIVVKLGSLPTSLGPVLMVASVALFVGGIAVEGSFDIESDPLRWIDQDSEVVEDVDTLEERTGFSSTLGVLVESNNVLTDEVTALLWDFTVGAEQRDDVISSSSLANTMGKIIAVPDTSNLPPTSADVVAAAEVMPTDVAAALLSEDRTTTQVNLRLGQASLEDRAVIVEELEEDLLARITTLNLPDDSILLQDLPEEQPVVRAVPAGLAVVGVGLLENLSANRAVLTYLGLALVALWFLIRFRSISRALLSLVPVGLAIGASSIIVAIAGIELSPLTTVSGPLVIATCTEFSVLITSRYLEERQKGHPAREATDRAAARTGRAFFTSAATTIGGFAVLIGSALPLLRDFGIIVTLNVAVALLSALVVMPPLLVWADNRNLLETGEITLKRSVRLAGPANSRVLATTAIAAIAVLGAIVALYSAAETDDGESAAVAYTPTELPTTTTTTPPTTTAAPGEESPGIDPTTFPADRPTEGLVAPTLFDLLTAQGADPQQAVCTGEVLLSRISENELIALGLASLTPEAVEPIEAAALDCGIPQETIDATIEAGL